MIGKTIVIGFGYKARRGKDTAVAAICRAYPRLARRYAFADALREQINAAALDQYLQDGEPAEAWAPETGMRHLCSWAGVPYEEGAEKQRALLQWWGMARRDGDPDYWVKLVSRAIEKDQPVFALLADLRFFSERSICDYIVRMDRPGFEIADGAHHVSEHELDKMPDEAWTEIIRAQSVEQVEWDAVSVFEKLAFAQGGVVESSGPILVGEHCCGLALSLEKYEQLVKDLGLDRNVPVRSFHVHVPAGPPCVK